MYAIIRYITHNNIQIPILNEYVAVVPVNDTKFNTSVPVVNAQNVYELLNICACTSSAVLH